MVFSCPKLMHAPSYIPPHPGFWSFCLWEKVGFRADKLQGLQKESLINCSVISYQFINVEVEVERQHRHAVSF